MATVTECDNCAARKPLSWGRRWVSVVRSDGTSFDFCSWECVAAGAKKQLPVAESLLGLKEGLNI